MTTGRTILAAALLAACSRTDPPRFTPYVPGDPDAGPLPDAFEPPPDIPADAQDDTWTWRPRSECYGYQTIGQYLDVTLPLEEQTGATSDSSIIVFKKCAEELSTWGGFWFRGFAFLSGGDDLFLDGDGEGEDRTVVPPRVYQVGEVVGPDDRWVDPAPGLQTEHIQDPVEESAPTQIWFMEGIIGVRFSADDGFHYAFVEIGWDDSADPGDYDHWRSRYVPLRWAYNPVPDQPLVIPP